MSEYNTMHVIPMIILASVLGGIVNYIRKTEVPTPFNQLELLKSIFVGVVASAMGPLFMNLTNIETLKSNKN